MENSIFFVILSILLGMKSTLAKKISTKNYFYLFILFVTFFQSCYLSNSQKVATHCKEQNKKTIMIIV